MIDQAIAILSRIVAAIEDPELRAQGIEALAVLVRSERSERVQSALLRDPNSKSAIRARRWRDNKGSVQSGVQSVRSLPEVPLMVSPITPSLILPNPSKESSSKASFDAWWQFYPHKVGKADAQRKYEIALKRATPADLLDGLKRYVENKPPDRPWCNPATWLHQNRWLDEPATPPATGKPNGHAHELWDVVPTYRGPSGPYRGT